MTLDMALVHTKTMYAQLCPIRIVLDTIMSHGGDGKQGCSPLVEKILANVVPQPSDTFDKRIFISSKEERERKTF